MNSKTIEHYRKLFPVTKKYIYLDHAGVSPMSLRVTEAIDAFLAESASGGAFHYPSWGLRVAACRNNCAQLLNAEPDEIAFVKSTSHGLSIVASGLDWKPGDNILIFEKEFPSNLYPWMRLQAKGVQVRVIPSKNERVLLKDIEQLIDKRTRLVALSAVQFSNGFRIDLHKLGELCHARNVLLCIDAIQSLGILPMDVKALHIDFLSADAHKWLLGPEGIGIFYCRSGLAEQLDPPLIGWKSVQNESDFDHANLLLKTGALRFEEGSMNLLGIFGLNAAIELLFEAGITKIEQRVLDLGDLIIEQATNRGFEVATPLPRSERGGNITVRGTFDPVKMRDALRGKGIMINARGGGIRVSPHFYNTEDEIRKVFEEIDGMS